MLSDWNWSEQVILKELIGFVRKVNDERVFPFSVAFKTEYSSELVTEVKSSKNHNKVGPLTLQ